MDTAYRAWLDALKPGDAVAMCVSGSSRVYDTGTVSRVTERGEQ